MLFQKVLLILSTASSIVSAAGIACGADSHCPESAPCCSQYGECGTGRYCLGGCHPAYSFSNDACMPMPVCKDSSTTFDDSHDFVDQSVYLGNPDDGDWYYTGYVANFGGSSILAMPNQTSGTVISSTRFVWYGKVGATFKTARSSGVVSAFILFSNSQDEIDWEFVGSQLDVAETNFYYQAVLNYSNVDNIPTSDTYANYHTYEIDWTEDKLTWYLDDVAVRTLHKADTWNETTNSYHYPQTPSRIQFSLWPVGTTAGIGTQQWAGTIDWNAEDIKNYGYFYFLLKSATLTCYDPPSDVRKYGDSAYQYDDSGSYNAENVIMTDNSTVLNDENASGLNNTEYDTSSSSSSSSSHISTANNSSTILSNSSTTSTTSTTTSKKSTTSTSTSTSTSSTSTAPTVFVQFAQSTASSGFIANTKNAAAAIVESGSLLSLVLAMIAAFGAF